MPPLDFSAAKSWSWAGAGTTLRPVPLALRKRGSAITEMEFYGFIQRFADRFGSQVPEIVDEAAAFDAGGTPLYCREKGKNGART